MTAGLPNPGGPRSIGLKGEGTWGRFFSHLDFWRSPGLSEKSSVWQGYDGFIMNWKAGERKVLFLLFLSLSPSVFFACGYTLALSRSLMIG